MLSAPEWLPDPTGRHALRYWDGTRWTDSVDDGTGTPSADPLPQPPPPATAVAGWYPDPTGLHSLRYWDGVQWSASVVSGGASAEDMTGVDDTTVAPRATVPGWHPDPSGRFAIRFWDTDHWTATVCRAGHNQPESSEPAPEWAPPTGDRQRPPAPVGMRMARKAGWHMGASMSLRAQGRDHCPQCGAKLTCVEAARPGCQIEYTPETTAVNYPPCPSCGAVPPWATPDGLYADPTGRHEYRYWDGLTWTDRVADGGVGSSDAVAGSAGA